MEMLENTRNLSIIDDGEEIYFFSYETLIASYHKAGEFIAIYYELENKSKFTQTTTKQFYHFINEYTKIYLPTNSRNELNKLIEGGQIIKK